MTTAAYAISPDDNWFFEKQDRWDARDTLREEHEESVMATLLDVGKKADGPLFKVEQQCRDEAMEACFDTLFSHPDQQSRLEEVLLQLWAKYRKGDDSLEHQLAVILEHGFTAFAHEKAKVKYR